MWDRHFDFHEKYLFHTAQTPENILQNRFTQPNIYFLCVCVFEIVGLTLNILSKFLTQTKEKLKNNIFFNEKFSEFCVTRRFG